MFKSLATVFGLVWFVSSCTSPTADWKTVDGRVLTTGEIDETINRLIAANEVQGFAISLIADGEVAYVKGYGKRMVEKDLPLEPDTIIYGASLTKATFAYYVMQLVDDGLIDLDKTIDKYLPQPLSVYDEYKDQAGDDRWHILTLRMLLSHQSGLPNWRFLPQEGGYDPDGKLEFMLDPGTRYAYSGEGFELAQRVIEWGLERDVGQDMQRLIFDQNDMNRTSMTWRDDFIENYSHNYSITNENLRHGARAEVNVAGSMDTTVADWSRLLATIVRGEGLSAASYEEMISPQVRIRSEVQFPTFDEKITDVYNDIELSYGLGWGTFNTPYGRAFFKEGHDEGTANYAICIEPLKKCLLMMPNSVRAEGIFKEVVETILGDVKLPWRWENYIPYNLKDNPNIDDPNEE